MPGGPRGGFGGASAELWPGSLESRSEGIDGLAELDDPRRCPLKALAITAPPLKQEG